MQTVALVSEDEYLHTVYEAACEYEDGLVIERNVGDEDHSWLQLAIGVYFFNRRKLWNIEAYTEQRFRVRQGKYMIPDLCVIPAPRRAEKTFTTPPLIWIEILSPEDRLMRVNRKIRQLLDFGVPNIWVIDPTTLESEINTQAGTRLVEDAILRIEGTAIEVPLRGLNENQIEPPTR